jgi:hypothetical protein
MASSSAPAAGRAAISPGHRDALAILAADLRRIFGVDLHALVAYGLEHVSAGEPLHTLALVERVTFDHLAACAPVTDTWRRGKLAVPLILSREEFARTLDVFPLEYHAILSDHVLVEGQNPFQGLRVAESDLRRACEAQTKSHLIHLREGFLEGSREPRAIAHLIASSAPAFRAVLRNISILDGTGLAAASDDGIAASAEAAIGVPAAVVREVLAYDRQASAATDPTALLSRYIAAAEQVWLYVDRWRR